MERENLFYPIFNISEGFRIDQKIFKKTLLAECERSADKKFINQEIQDLFLRYVINSDNSNMPAIVSETEDYSEIALLEINLRSTLNKIDLFVHTLQSIIPYQCIIVLRCGDEFIVSSAIKRINQADQSKTVLIQELVSEPINLGQLTEIQGEFIKDCDFSSFIKDNIKIYFDQFYLCLLRLCIADRRGSYQRLSINLTPKNIDLSQQIFTLINDFKLLRNRLIRTKQLNQRVEISDELKYKKIAIHHLIKQFE